MTREKMIERLVQNDIDDIYQALLQENDTEFITRVLTGEGWKPYNQLTDKEILQEYKNREFVEK